MRKHVTLLLLCILSLQVYAQKVYQYNTYTKESLGDGVDQYFEAELADVYGYIVNRGPNLSGSCKLMYQNGGYAVGNFENGIMDGSTKIYGPANNILHDYLFSKGKLNGHYLQYSINTGNIITDGNYKMGKRDGTWKSFKEDGTLVKEEEYSNDVLTKYKNIDEKNNIEVAEIDAEGKLNGKYLKYINGHLAADCEYKDGMKNGTCLTYSITTDKMVKSEEFVNDKLNGTTIKYDYLGYKTYELQYQNNKLVKEIAFKPDGSVKYERAL